MPTKHNRRGFEPPPVPSIGGFERRRSTAMSTTGIPDSELLGSGLRSLSTSPSLKVKNSSRPRSAKFSSYRLRSNSGLSLHTNEDILRQYTDYYPDGTPRLPMYGNGGAAWPSDKSKSIGSVASSQRPTMTYTDTESSDLPIPDFLGGDVFDMVMKDPTASDKLWKFAASQGLGQNVEYLMKIRDYSQSLEQVVAQLSKISTSYTSITATSPLNLPAPISKALNSNIKHLTTTFMPSLNNLFMESKSYIEQRIMRDIFPAFVKQQLSLQTTMAISSTLDGGPRFSGYPGFKGSFCMSDPSKAGNPLVYASDGFEDLSGYSRYEILSRGCRFLQSPLTDRETVTRIRQAVWRREECTELILNSRRDGQSFWNLLYLCPIKDAASRHRFYFGAQIDVSADIHGPEDVLDLLRFGGQDDEKSDERCPHDKYDYNAEFEPDDSSRSHHGKSSKRSFFNNPFKKAPPSPVSPPLSPRRSYDRPTSPATTITTIEKTYSTRSVLQKFSITNELVTMPYHRFMVLQHTSMYPASLSTMSIDELSMIKKYPPRLNISFCSKAIVEALDLGMTADAVMQKDVFDVLAEQINSPSITKAFRSAVRDAVVGDGRSFSIELAIPKHGPKRPGHGRGGHSDDAESMYNKKSSKHDKHGKQHVEKMVSHWTPLKDADDQVRYVVLLILPSAAR